ncbi:M48 family metallopeptidase [Acetobacter indonesiensis]|uniref:M48 family metallopeptidase n=1 Tax=Acetobacter indonesiensis TaxID=104101 RepID=UPI001F15D9FD|nr:SprT family zinc-dependent metalloprotease [Acetobacter indonesiensis]MCG0996393.1 M48 family metallopeptidase [Acetobacter indonesiensis]
MTRHPPETLILNNQPVPVIWRPSSRTRRLSVRIDPKHQAVIVTYPPNFPRPRALLFLQNQSHWVTSRLTTLNNAPSFAPGSVIPICGAPHTIVHHPHARGGVWLEGTALCVSGEQEFIGRRISDFLKNHARSILGQELRTVAQQNNLTPTRLDIRDTSTRWGSCSSSGRIMLSWRLVMAEHAVRHYLIAHELAHLKHMNHSPAFWAFVDTLTPHRKQAEAWLKRHGSQLLSMR